MKNLKRFKLVIIGNCHIGKTSLTIRYVNKYFRDVFKSTIGCSFFSKQANINEYKCLLDIWDTAGQERYRSLLPMYYRDAHIIFLCFNLNNNTTLDISNTIQYWISETDKYIDFKSRLICLVGTKSDLTEDKDIQLIQDFIHEKYPDYLFFITSSKNNEGVNAMFEESITKAIKRDNDHQDNCLETNTTDTQLINQVKTKTFFEKMCSIL